MEAEEEFVSGWTYEEFAADLKTQFAVIKDLSVKTAFESFPISRKCIDA